MNTTVHTHDLPGSGLDLDKMPGHWLLAQMGKRVLRPGGLELTQQMLDGLAITSGDHVVELAPGLGTTARMVLASAPATYTGIDRDKAAVANTEKLLRPGRDRCLRGQARRTGLGDSSATVLFGEAMLTMQTDTQKARIIEEAFRVLSAGGRYGIHEIGLVPDDLPEERKAEVQRELSSTIHVGARPLTLSEWRALLEGAGFEVVHSTTAPMHLLEPSRMLRDEGLLGVLRIAFNVARTPAARRRIVAMRSVFQRFAPVMCAVSVVARKPA
jgi:hypothetical protein